MMNEAYFLSKHDLLQWINGLLNLQIGKVESMSTGAAYCQMMDALFPGSVSMARIKWNAITEFDKRHNWKLLQQSFSRNGVDKVFDTETLIRGKPLDNTEFMQWAKCFFDANWRGSEPYDAVARRGRVRTPWDVPSTTVVAQPRKEQSRQRPADQRRPQPLAISNDTANEKRVAVLEQEITDAEKTLSLLQSDISTEIATRPQLYAAVDQVHQLEQKIVKEQKAQQDKIAQIEDETQSTLEERHTCLAQIRQESLQAQAHLQHLKSYEALNAASMQKHAELVKRLEAAQLAENELREKQRDAQVQSVFGGEFNPALESQNSITEQGYLSEKLELLKSYAAKCRGMQKQPDYSEIGSIMQYESNEKAFILEDGTVGIKDRFVE